MCCISQHAENGNTEETQQGVWKPGVFFNVKTDGLLHFKACCLCIGLVARLDSYYGGCKRCRDISNAESAYLCK